MKKIEKTLRTCYYTRWLLNFYKAKFGITHETWEELEEDEEVTLFQELMITFYDENHQKIVSNWLSNSESMPGYFSGWDYFRMMCQNDVYNMSRYYHLDLLHLTWEQPWLLSKARYVSIGRRDEDRITEHIEGTKYRSYYIEKGYECKLHGSHKPTKYERKVDFFEYDTTAQPEDRRRPRNKVANEETA